METDKTNQLDVNNIKIGNFQLQTKSFWLSTITILCLFILLVFYFNYKIVDNVLTHCENILKQPYILQIRQQ